MTIDFKKHALPQNFDEIIVHYFRDEWVLTWLDLGFGDASSVVTAIHVEEKSPVFIRVSQVRPTGCWLCVKPLW